MKKLLLIVAALCALSTGANALEGTLQPPGKLPTVWVWRDNAAQNEALALIRAGVQNTNPELIVKHIACIVPGGTKVIITDMGFMSHDILVVEGNNAGCRGNIPSERFKRK